jgi:hypothetical protein
MCAFLEDVRRLLDRDSGELRTKASSQDDFDSIATATSRYLCTAMGYAFRFRVKRERFPYGRPLQAIHGTERCRAGAARTARLLFASINTRQRPLLDQKTDPSFESSATAP